MGSFESLFHEVYSLANLFAAWNEFERGKRKKRGVAVFELHLEENLFNLHEELSNKTYKHNPYEDFYVCDPKRRHIHKASVRDRVMHQALFRVLCQTFDKHFIYDSYSSRNDKGTHKGVNRLQGSIRKVSRNWKKTVWILKCDVRKFFDSIDHDILREFIVERVKDADILWLVDIIFASFEKEKGKGLPLGNVTSQLFANIYLNELDQFIKHTLKAKHYFRYCDDFVIVHSEKSFLESSKVKIEEFMGEKLHLILHPDKVEIRKVSQGVDFLGYVILSHAVVLRTKTKRRISRKIKEGVLLYNKKQISQRTFNSILNSYIGVFFHSKSKKETQYLRNIVESLQKGVY